MSILQSMTFASQGQHAALQKGKINEPRAQQNYFWFQMKMTSNPESVALGHPPYCQFAFLSFHITETLNQALPCQEKCWTAFYTV